MKKILLLIFLSTLFVLPVFAQGSAENRKDLQDLLEIRRKKFEAYSNSLEKKSGFFGNKTKKDVQHSHDVLSEIVETDNRIISSLNHVIDFRNFEKVNSNYDMLANDERLSTLQRANDTLTSRADAFAFSNTILKNKIRMLNWLVYSTSFVIIWLLISRFKRKSV
jgi:hypothetical protein